MATPLKAPFVVPITTTPLNIRTMPIPQQPLPPITPLPPHQFFYTNVAAADNKAPKKKVKQRQLFQNHNPVNKKRNFKRNKNKKVIVVDRGIQKKSTTTTKKYNIAPFSLDDEIEIEIEFTINKK